MMRSLPAIACAGLARAGCDLTNMAVTIKIPKILQDKTNGALLVTVQGTTVYECIADLIRRYPSLQGRILDAEGNILLQWIVYINNQIASRSNELSIRLRDGDKIALLPMIAGG